MRSTPKEEDIHKARLIECLKITLGTSYFVQAPQDIRKSGNPDLILSGDGKMSQWEIKHATPRFLCPEIQRWTCSRIAKSAYCRYVIFVEGFWPNDDHLRKETWIVHPDRLAECKGRLTNVRPEIMYPGYNHLAVVLHMQSVHRGTLPPL